MTSRKHLLVFVAVLLLSAPLALTPPAAAQTPAVTPQLTALFTVLPEAAPACPGAGFLALSPQPQSDAAETCSTACSDTACAGQPINSVCAPGFRCIGSLACTSAGGRRCQCLII
ncbi:MAG TPA: hypothetical protein VMM92_06290 [Thermoanaerobaculia bacterium]|nr:hypothetical protein [Thermoanaerobaculia bacterium]